MHETRKKSKHAYHQQPAAHNGPFSDKKSITKNSALSHQETCSVSPHNLYCVRACPHLLHTRASGSGSTVAPPRRTFTLFACRRKALGNFQAPSPLANCLDSASGDGPPCFPRNVQDGANATPESRRTIELLSGANRTNGQHTIAWSTGEVIVSGV